MAVCTPETFAFMFIAKLMPNTFPDSGVIQAGF
jgi:hypothetical protein